MGGYSNENSDTFCKELLETGDPQEVREWIYQGDSSLGELPHDESVALAEKIYQAGAVHLYGVEIEEIDPQTKNTGRLVVELPANAQQRKRVLDWAAGVAHEQGFDAESDVGQQYVFVMLD